MTESKPFRHSVVINNCYGGFGLSGETVKMMAELGHKKAIEVVEDRINWFRPFGGTEADEYPYLADYNDDFTRHDIYLIEAVKLVQAGGLKAGGDCSELLIVEIPGIEYRIENYDGWESIYWPEAEEYTKIEPEACLSLRCMKHPAPPYQAHDIPEDEGFNDLTEEEEAELIRDQEALRKEETLKKAWLASVKVRKRLSREIEELRTVEILVEGRHRVIIKRKEKKNG